MQRNLLALFILTATSITPALAAREHRQHGPHQHGVATLTLALADHTLDVEFESPAVNLVGFEHAPRDAGQQRAVANAMQQLRSPAALLALSKDAHCSAVTAAVTSSLQNSPAQAEQENAHGNVHAHNDGDDDEHHHADINATYRFQCDQPQALHSVDVRLFATFSGIEKINAQWLTATTQNAKVLTPTDQRITLQ